MLIGKGIWYPKQLLREFTKDIIKATENKGLPMAKSIIEKKEKGYFNIVERNTSNRKSTTKGIIKNIEIIFFIIRKSIMRVIGKKRLDIRWNGKGGRKRGAFLS